jgi:uncharacterized membrane protein (UPF0182 family)
MYAIAIGFLLGLGFYCIRSGRRLRRRGRIAVGALVWMTTLAFFAGMSFWTELLWFEALGYLDRFWTMVQARVAAVLLGAGVAFVATTLLVRPFRVVRRALGWWPEALAAAGGMLWGLVVWDELLLLVNRVPAGMAEPILGLDAGFYLFVLPFLDHLFWLGVFAASLAVVCALAAMMLPALQREPALYLPPDRRFLAPVCVATATLSAVVALGAILGGLHLLFSGWGVVTGPGWIDANVRLPAYALTAAATLVIGLSPLVRPLRQGLQRFAQRARFRRAPEIAGLAVAWAGIGAVWLIFVGALPALVQTFIVQPNEVSFERPYLAHNIEFTRKAFRLDRVEERQFPASDTLTRAMVARSPHLTEEARLWDWRALTAVYKQFQEIRLYYEFNDVDMDRYRIDGRYRQVMVSARELDQRNLAAGSQTYVNRRYKYTHGYGLTLAAVRDFTPDGLPNLIVRDIPPVSDEASLRVDRPQIYYGELTGDPVVVITREKEFDHPRGDENVYSVYDGQGGVPLETLWRKFMFAWRFDGTRFFLSYYPMPETKVLFHRAVRKRVAALAPFLVVDDDPYPVLVDGRLYWIVDAYTTSAYFPYSEPFAGRESIEVPRAHGIEHVRGPVAPSFEGANYVRNSVKAVVDAYDGTVDLYVFDEEDPIVTVWRRAFPELLQDHTAMPEGLRAHVRYPHAFLLAQGAVYAKYHMTDPDVFYNQEDLWVRATEKYYADVLPVEPYYVMWRHPDSEETEFVLILPFTPRNRQVLIGWIAGLCDGENYGRFLAYKFPKERRVLGPQQVETKIDQDRVLSAQLTLWDQHGSSVIRGNVLAIPIEDTLVYVEPISLQADAAAYPELRLVALMHGDRLSYASTFEEALAGLFEEPTLPAVSAPPPARFADRDTARDAFEGYLEAQAEHRFADAASELERLDQALAERPQK